MSTTEQFIGVARGVADQELGDLILAGVRNDWTFLRTPRWTNVSALEEIAVRFGPDAGLPSLAIAVETSDWAFGTFLAPGTPPARVVLDPRSASEFSDGVEALNLAGVDHRETFPDAFAEWAGRGAPTTPSAGHVRRVIGKRWVVPEEGIAALLGLVDLEVPSAAAGRVQFGEAVFVNDEWSMFVTVSPLRVMDLRDVRYLPGHGRDFWGIWDRMEPAVPVVRFPKTEEGHRELVQRWHQLIGDWIEQGAPGAWKR